MISEQVTLVFSSDHSVAGAGFTASYVMVDATRECGGRHTTDTGVLRSPGFPDPYPHNRCELTKTIIMLDNHGYNFTFAGSASGCFKCSPGNKFD